MPERVETRPAGHALNEVVAEALGWRRRRAKWILDRHPKVTGTVKSRASVRPYSTDWIEGTDEMIAWLQERGVGIDLRFRTSFSQGPVSLRAYHDCWFAVLLRGRVVALEGEAGTGPHAIANAVALVAELQKTEGVHRGR